ncbi:MAG: type II toxin-antitoxin system PemK/MazF family toxin [Pseudonocardia sp.]|nr:type II toxin-antitoxin system PemK/MazF family toxin [Pseudonocardia sp.]
MLRGEIWAYRPQGSPRQPLVVIVSNDGINQSTRSWLLCAPITTEDPADILAVPIPAHGWADASNISRFYRGWLAERVDVLDADTLEQLAAMLRAALDL